MMIRLRAAAALLLLAVAGSCGDSTFSGDEGIFSFRYSGEISGTFSAGGMGSTSFARGEYLSRVSADGAFRRNGVWHEAFVQAPTNRPGRYRFAPGGSLNDAAGSFAIRAPEDAFGNPYVFVSGTLEVTHVTDERLRGRFSGTARRGNDTIQIMDGHFDLAFGMVGSGN